MSDSKAQSRSRGVRIDKWLWYARRIKTRSKATRLVRDGRIRVNRERVAKASHLVYPGDVITASINSLVLVLEVVETGSRRGPANEAQELYKDLTPVIEPHEKRFRAVAQPPKRERGTGRPTKRERRQTDRLRQRALYDNEGE